MKRIFTRLTVLTLVSAFIVPMINTVVVWPFYISALSDIAYADWVSELLHELYSALDILIVYAMAFCLAWAFRRKGERLKISLIVALSLVVVCAAAIFVDVYYYGKEILTPKFVGYNALRVALDALRLAVTALVTFLLVKRGRSHMLCTGVILLSEFIMNVVETVSIFRETAKEYENWAPQNSSEWLTIATPYINMVIYFILGYFLCRGLLRLLDGKKTQQRGG